MADVGVTADVGTVFEDVDAVNAARLDDGYEVQNSYGQVPLVRVRGRWVSRDFDGDPFDDLTPADWDGTFTVTKRGN